ncbi:MAG: D-glycerate dehydrogenase [Methylothermaceae bacteria B42]|nr:MAG: D-glycerate dehydrogenase [Methylothermaceae bacteria B42]HHJ39829.1 D-glycerate dehydrogenase [Methylothermaceae bacterium]
MTTRPTVILTRRWPPSVEAQLRRRYEVTLNEDDHPFSSQDLQSALQHYDAVCPTVTDSITAEVLNTTPLRCRILANYGVGVNHIDLETAAAKGITVTNTPGVLTDCTADIAITLLLMAARRAGEGEREVRAGRWRGWRPTHLLGTKVTGKTLGIIGMGRIGQAVAKRARHGFGMKILYFHPRPVADETLTGLDATACASIDELLPQCDFVSLHCPGGQRNFHLIDAHRLALMPSHAFLINTARGDVVDTEALIQGLKEAAIRGAGLDVYENEPQIDPRLLALDNVVLLPHLGSATEETREAMGLRVLTNLDAFFSGQTPPDIVA